LQFNSADLAHRPGLTSFYTNASKRRDYNSSVAPRVKSSLVLAALPLILLPCLAVLQYRWIGEVSAAERDRLESSLRVASDQFATDFDTEFSRLANSFQIRDGLPETAGPVLERYQTWSESAGYPHLVRAMYLLKLDPDGAPEFNRIDLQSGALQPESLPKDLQNMGERLRPGATVTASGGPILLSVTAFRRGRPFATQRGTDFRPPRPDRPSERGSAGGQAGGFGPGGPGFGGPGASAEGAVVIELDRDVILKDLVPALVEKHFSSHDETAYRVAIVNRGASRVLYSSAGDWTPQDISKPDGEVSLFGGPPPPGPNNPGGNPPTRRGGRTRNPGPFRGFLGTPLNGQPWQLLIKHRAGSLEQAVDQLRRKDLALSFGILMILAAGLITVVASSQRAHTFGRLQMEFAAGVSHELRTPLAVIRSAAHNLRSGVVRDKEDVEQYAAIVQEEARRLSDMVEEVLLYSETQSGRKKYNLEPIDIHEVIDRAITNVSPAIDLENCELSTHIDQDLPRVKADAAGLAQCLQNLLSNAFKYGQNGSKTQIDIVGQHDRDSKEVRLSVVDHGPGIDPADQRHLFEPFYRGRGVGSNVPGNGLGLHLVKRIMQAQGGRVTFNPAPLGGASFTLHIPIAS
jgi:signal transduction histidine kinase